MYAEGDPDIREVPVLFRGTDEPPYYLPGRRPAQALVSPGNEEELSRLIRCLNREKIDWKILGNGSNLLVSDQGVRGIVISWIRPGLTAAQRIRGSLPGQGSA